jgi:hypothetical protein
LRVFAAAGGLISYGPDIVDEHRRAATYVDRILRGEKPADLPVQAPTRYEYVINLKTARTLGLTIPESGPLGGLCGFGGGRCRIDRAGRPHRRGWRGRSWAYFGFGFGAPTIATTVPTFSTGPWRCRPEAGRMLALIRSTARLRRFRWAGRHPCPAYQ